MSYLKLDSATVTKKFLSCLLPILFISSNGMCQYKTFYTEDRYFSDSIGEPRISIETTQEDPWLKLHRYVELSDVEERYDSLSILRAYFTEVEDKEGHYYALRETGNALFLMSRITDAHDSLLMAMRQLEYVSLVPYVKKIEKASLLGLLADLAFQSGKIKESMKYVESLIELDQSIDYVKGNHRVNNLVKIGNIFSQLKYQEKSRSFYLRADKIATSLNDTTLMGKTQSSLAIYYARSGLLDSAIVVSENSIRYTRKVNDSIGLAGKLLNLGGIHYFKKNFEEAEKKFREALQLSMALKIDRVTVRAKGNLCELYSKMKKYNLVEATMEEVINFRKRNNMITGLVTDYSNLVNFYETQGITDKALEALKMKMVYVDSLNSIKNRKYAEEFSVKLGLIEKENRILALNQEKLGQENKFQRIMGLAGFLILGLSLGFVTTYYKNKNSLLIEQRHNLEIEQRLLRSQMNPHFIFNALGSIQSFLVSSGQADKGAYYLAKFAKLMREILEQSSKSLIPLEKELLTLDNYLALQKLRYQNKFEYTIEQDIPTDDPDSHLYVPPMIIQPLVENAIEHGKIHTLENGQVTIRILRHEQELEIHVIDNGIGIKESRIRDNYKAEKSVAIDIIKQRIRTLTINQKKNASLHYDDLPSGTKVVIMLPIIFSPQ